MKTKTIVRSVLAIGLACTTTFALAYDADWKRGRVYYRSVCTACHAAQAGGSIAPSTMTKAQWVSYLQADKHAKGIVPASSRRTRRPRNLLMCLMKNSLKTSRPSSSRARRMAIRRPAAADPTRLFFIVTG